MQNIYIRLHPQDRKLLEKAWIQSIKQRRAAYRYPYRRSRRRPDLLTYLVQKLVDGFAWLVWYLVMRLLNGLQWLVWHLVKWLLFGLEKLYRQLVGFLFKRKEVTS